MPQKWIELELSLLSEAQRWHLTPSPYTNAIKLAQVIDMPDEVVAHRSPRNSVDMICRDEFC